MNEEEKEYLGPSLDPDDAISGGLFDNKVATWTDCKFEMYDYNGTTSKAPVFTVTLVPQDGDDAYVQKYSVGKADFWAPTDDGTWIRPVGTEKQLRKNSNMNILMQSLLENGLPKAFLKDRNITVLNGLVAHMERKAIPGREDLFAGREKRRGADGKEYERDNKILLVSSILSLPGESGEKKQAKGGAGKKAPEATKKKDAAKPVQEQAPGSGGAEDKARSFLAEMILANDGKIEKSKLSNAVFKAFGTDPDRNAVLAIMVNSSKIKALGGFEIDDAGIITLG